MISTHTIRILGRELQVRSASAPEHVARVEALVNEKLSEAGVCVSTGDTQAISILAMMNLAEAFLAAQQQLDQERRTCKERVTGLIGRLDRQAN